MNKPEFFIKRPGNGRASFAIVKRVRPEQGRPVNTTVRSEKLDAVNAAFRAGTIGLVAAEMEAKALCESLQKRAEIEFKGAWVASEENLKLLKRYWAEVYERRKIVGKKSAHNRLAHAIDLLGPHSLLLEGAELQRVVDERTRGNPRKQRRVASVLNQMRKHFGISSDRIALEKPLRPKFRYLTRDEFSKVMRSAEFAREAAALYTVLFYSGARLSESFAFRPEHLRRNSLTIASQAHLGGTGERPTKTGRVRRTVLFDEGVEAFHEWTQADTSPFNRTSLSKHFRAACKKLFPKRPDKWCSAHDLRHSYAVMCLTEHDISISAIAKLLGNSVTVCETYYLNFIAEDDFISSVVTKIRKAR
jgi:integrase